MRSAQHGCWHARTEVRIDALGQPDDLLHAQHGVQLGLDLLAAHVRVAVHVQQALCSGHQRPAQVGGVASKCAGTPVTICPDFMSELSALLPAVQQLCHVGKFPGSKPICNQLALRLSQAGEKRQQTCQHKQGALKA